MKLRPEQLAAALNKGPASIYVVSGDEPLLVEESAALIRGALREAGVGERQSFQTETSFKWAEWLAGFDCLSLFAERRLIDLVEQEAAARQVLPQRGIERALVRPLLPHMGGDVALDQTGEIARRTVQDLHEKSARGADGAVGIDEYAERGGGRHLLRRTEVMGDVLGDLA